MVEEKRYISSVQLEENYYYIKDLEAREALNTLLSGTLLLDGGTSTINVDNVVAEG